MADNILTSDWGSGTDGLNKHLIASFVELKREGNAWKRNGDVIVQAPFTEASMEVALSWNSPFENSGADKGIPTISAMLQSGEFAPLLNAAGLGESGFAKSINEFQGRTGITKLNSTQVFSGMPPVKIQVTALFRAWSNPYNEVERPFNHLMAWALPVKLETDGAILSTLGAAKDRDIHKLLPSLAPVCIAMTYKGKTYSPLVIESIGHPMSSPIDKNGNYTELLVPMTLCTLTAIDRNDWGNRTSI